MTNESKTPTQAPKNRVTLDTDCLLKIDRLVKQVSNETKGVSIKRSELVNWILRSHSEVFNSKELAIIAKDFFDEVAFMTWALDALRKAKQRGEATSMKDLLKERPDRPSSSLNAALKKPSSNVANNDFLSENAQKTAQKMTLNSSKS